LRGNIVTSNNTGLFEVAIRKVTARVLPRDNPGLCLRREWVAPYDRGRSWVVQIEYDAAHARLSRVGGLDGRRGFPDDFGDRRRARHDTVAEPTPVAEFITDGSIDMDPVAHT